MVSRRQISQESPILRQAKARCSAPFLSLAGQSKLDFYFPFADYLHRQHTATTFIEFDSIRVEGEVRLRRDATFGRTASPLATKLIRYRRLPLSKDWGSEQKSECQ